MVTFIGRHVPMTTELTHNQSTNRQGGSMKRMLCTCTLVQYLHLPWTDLWTTGSMKRILCTCTLVQHLHLPWTDLWTTGSMKRMLCTCTLRSTDQGTVSLAVSLSAVFHPLLSLFPVGCFQKMYPFTSCVGVEKGGIWSYYLKQRLKH